MKGKAMKRLMMAMAAGSVLFGIGYGTSIAQEEAQSDTMAPVELYACNFNDGKGPADLDAAVGKWNKWADKRRLNEYSAWNLVPFYRSASQEFDFIWLGTSPTARALGAAQDDWLATGGDVQEVFRQVFTCDAHTNYASLQLKAPAEREDPSNVVVSFSDCNMSDGASFGEVGPALAEWGAYLAAQGSSAGMWVFFPAYGGGGETFDFKFVSSHANYEDQGVDWDQYSASGWQKADELFAGKLDCDSSRVYSAATIRTAENDD
jgi:hypothetical protein